MPSTAKEFFTLMVEPTVNEFIKAPHDLRRGLLAAMVLNHMADHFALDGKPSSDRKTMDSFVNETRESLQKLCPDFQFIRDIADATKHAKLSTQANPNKPTREVSSSNQVSASPGLFQAPFGQGVFREAVVVFAILQDGSSKPLLPAVKAVLEAWQNKLGRTQ